METCPAHLSWKFNNTVSMLGIGLLQNVSVCDKVTPANVVDGAVTALINALKETHVSAVGDPGF